MKTFRTTILSRAGVGLPSFRGTSFAARRSQRRRSWAVTAWREPARNVEVERLRLELSLAATRAAEVCYRTVVDHLPNTAIMVWDRYLRLETVTGPGATTWRYEERNVVPGRMLEDIVDSELAAILRPFYESGLLARGTLSFFSEPTGLYFEFDVAPLPNAEGGPDRVLVMVRDVTDRKQLDLKLQHLAHHDTLSGLPNRGWFEAELDRHINYVDRYGPTGALLLLDLDHFKSVNDTLGHSVGDELIISVAGALKSRLRTTDLLARLGGDEFAVILPHVDRAQAEQVAQELLEIVRNVTVGTRNESHHRPTVSIGVALFERAALTAKQMLINADMAMYQAKHEGRNRFATHNPVLVTRECPINAVTTV